MQLINRKDYCREIWKNGNGITHEIARLDDRRNMVWRLSMAEVKTDGPFSSYHGYERVLTVIKGNGLELLSSKKTIKALCNTPVNFSGNLEINSKRINSDVQDLNLIFNPSKVRGTVSLVDKKIFNKLKFFKNRVFGLFCLEGEIEVEKKFKINKFSTLLFSGQVDHIDWSNNSSALFITIKTII